MQASTSAATLDALWDTLVALFFAALTAGLPDIFPSWMALGVLPLLACRAAIVQVERGLRT